VAIILTIEAVSRMMNADQEFFLWIREFLDRFYDARQAERPGMLANPPEDIGKFPFAVPYMAATVHKLANDFGLTPPDWIFDRRCFLPHGRHYFGFCATGLLREWYMYNSPSEFKFRNLFVDEDVLSRA
jgi:hypothetical protein